MSEPSYRLSTQTQGMTLQLEGDWCIGQPVPDFYADFLEPQDVDSSPDSTVHVSTVHGPTLYLLDEGIGQWDSMLMVFVMQCYRWSKSKGIVLDVQAMPTAVGKLLDVATAVRVYEPPTATEADTRQNFLGTRKIVQTYNTLKEFVEFTGRFTKSLTKFIRGEANTRSVDIFYFIEQVGPKGLGIITLISVLIGMILAYLGSVQLRQLGAQVYVADLVTIGMTREMGALMTGVILAGRTGAAYAAQLGTMQVNDEIDAIKTMAMSSMEFLVLPRMLALLLIMPLLVLYSDVLGMLGGAIIATGMDVSLSQYIQQTQAAIDMTDIFTGLVKSVFFALLIGIAGCQAGLQCGRDSTAVGHATTTAVVRAIVYLIAADAAFNVLYDKLGI